MNNNELKAVSVSLDYIPSEDRIQWLSRCSDNDLVRTWVTRRFIEMMMPGMAEWMLKKNERFNPSIGLTSLGQEEKKQIAIFEHELAQQQVRTVNQPMKEVRVIDTFLLFSLSMSLTKNGSVLLELSDEKKKVNVRFQASFQQTHKIIGEIMRLSGAAGWKINDPWKLPISPLADQGYGRTLN